MLPVSKNHALVICAETTCKSEVEFPTNGRNRATNNVKIGSLGSTAPSNGNSIAKAHIENKPSVDYKSSFNNIQDAESNIEDHHKNVLFVSIEDKKKERKEASIIQSKVHPIVSTNNTCANEEY